MGRLKRKRCRNCKKLFIPDHRNQSRQKYCTRPECRKASKAESQKKWLSKPENESYFKSKENILHVQEWRKANPGYWKRNYKNGDIALQEILTAQGSENITHNCQITKDALQEFLMAQSPVIIGLIAHFTGSTLQENISEYILRMQKSGEDILYLNNPKGGYHGTKITDFTKPCAQSP